MSEYRPSQTDQRPLRTDLKPPRTDYRPTCDPLALLFREVVIVLSGAFTVCGTDDETVCRIARGLKRVWERTRSVPAEPARRTLGPHPAMIELLNLAQDKGVAITDDKGVAQ